MALLAATFRSASLRVVVSRFPRMKDNPSESGPGQNVINKVVMEQAATATEGSQSDSELLRALAASVDRNERMQEKFHYAVVRRLARLEARARVLQLFNIVDSLKFGPVDRAVEQQAGIEAMVLELSAEVEQKMFDELSEKSQGRARRGGKRNWASWEI